MSFYFFIVLKMLHMYLNKEKQREMAVKLFSRNVEGIFIVTICPCCLMGCKVPKDLGNCYNSDTDVESGNGLILPNFMSIPFDYLHLWFISMRHSAANIAIMAIIFCNFTYEIIN